MFLIRGALIVAVMSEARNFHGIVILGLSVRLAIPKTSGLRKTRFFKPVIYK